MGNINEFSRSIRLLLRTYRWRRIDPIPWKPLQKPLSKCRLALVSSAGFVIRGQNPFDASVKGGDFSYREIPSDVNIGDLVESHRSKSFDHKGMLSDPNIAFPVDRVRELEKIGRIGSVNHRHISFMGSITAPSRLVRKTAPVAAQLLKEDGVDIALLVPV